jgi:hypothetical protein
MKDDLRLAKQRLKRRELSLVIVKDGRILFEDSSPGIAGLIRAIEELKDLLRGSALADRVVGRAVALLCAHSRISSLFALLLGQNALEVLRKHNIAYEYKKLVPGILDASKSGLCPLEQLCLRIDDPLEAYERLRAKVSREGSLSS